eukprot:1156622-Pelagomonas_calceolata.AAC.8
MNWSKNKGSKRGRHKVTNKKAGATRQMKNRQAPRDLRKTRRRNDTSMRGWGSYKVSRQLLKRWQAPRLQKCTDEQRPKQPQARTLTNKLLLRSVAMNG